MLGALRSLFALYRRHFFAGTVLVLAVVGALLFAGIWLFHPVPQRDLKSPSGKYLLTATVDRNTSTVRLHLKDPKGQPLASQRTTASDVMKWALGWMPAADTVVLYSSDAGTLCYAVTPAGKLSAIKVTPALDHRAQELKKEKYQ